MCIFIPNLFCTKQLTEKKRKKIKRKKRSLLIYQCVTKGGFLVFWGRVCDTEVILQKAGAKLSLSLCHSSSDTLRWRTLPRTSGSLWQMPWLGSGWSQTPAMSREAPSSLRQSPGLVSLISKSMFPVTEICLVAGVWKATSISSVQDWRKRLFELLTVPPTLKIPF